MNGKLKNYEISAVNLLRSSSSGILSTLSKSFKGYPFGSYVTFITGPDRSIYIYASTLAQHTKNLYQDSRACITLSKEKKDDDKQNVIISALQAQHQRRDKKATMIALCVDGYFIKSRGKIFFISFDGICINAKSYREMLIFQANQYRKFE